MDSTNQLPTNPNSAGVGLATGFALGLFGFFAALVAFGYEGLFSGGADPGDQLSFGLVSAYFVGLIAAIWVAVAALRARRTQPRKAMGLIAGLAVGVLLLALLTVRVLPLMNTAPHGCDCAPIIDQITDFSGSA